MFLFLAILGGGGGVANTAKINSGKSSRYTVSIVLKTIYLICMTQNFEKFILVIIYLLNNIRQILFVFFEWFRVLLHMRWNQVSGSQSEYIQSDFRKIT